MHSAKDVQNTNGASAGTEVIAATGPTVSDVINELHRNAYLHAETAVEDAIRCGEMLQQVKDSLKHGEWKPWIEANCDFVYQTAARYMKAATQKSTGVDFSALSRLYGPQPDDNVKKVDKKTAIRPVRATPSQIDADILELNTALENMQLPLMSADAFVSEAGTDFFTEKAQERFDWLVDLADMFANIENTPYE